jgi:WD40 repeat protein
VFTPKESIVRKQFKENIPAWIQLKPKVPVSWDATLQTLEGHSDFVTSVAFSHDSQLLASASWDKTVKIWDATTGSCKQTLEGHSYFVTSVAFSHDSQLLASASQDNTVKIWDANTGFCKQSVHFNEIISSLSFNSTNSVLSTNIGRMRVDGAGPTTFSNSSLKGSSNLEGLGISGSWITWYKQNLLWLPHDFRAKTYNISPSKSIVVGCCSSGKVFFIGFSLANLK